MKILEQKFINSETQEIEYTVIHIYAEHGHFERNGKRQGWHLSLGGSRKPEDYTEVNETGVVHNVPDSLPDVIIEPEPEPEEAEEIIDEGSNN